MTVRLTSVLQSYNHTILITYLYLQIDTRDPIGSKNESKASKETNKF